MASQRPTSRESVFRFLFRLAADARLLPPERVMQRLVTGLANRYAAAGCSLYRYGRLRATAWADPGPQLTRLSQQDRANLHNLDGRMVQEAMARSHMVSAMDLDVDGDVVDFLENDLEGMDIFAFPLTVEEGPRGALVLYLPVESDPLTDADMQALLALGEVLDVALDQARAAPQPDAVPMREPAERKKRA